MAQDVCITGRMNSAEDLKLEPADYGFTVLRKYEAVDNKDDVKQIADGSWTIKSWPPPCSGRRHNGRTGAPLSCLLWSIIFPAGLEILNPGLAVTEAIPADPGGGNTP
jgi:hypothetical protein